MNYENENYQHVAKVARKLWTIHAIIGVIFVGLVTMGVYFFAYKHLWIFGLVVLYGIIRIWILPAIEYKQWRYLINEDRIEIIHGIFFTKRILIPINRIQHLKIRQGILQKYFKLSTVDIYTAGGAHQIEALLYEEADHIVRTLNHLVVEKDEEPSNEA